MVKKIWNRVKAAFVSCSVVCCFALGCGQDNTDVDRGKWYSQDCLNGHVYYVSGHQLAIKLDDSGKPIRCGK